jgi:alkylation response protein AidB-like acyl-CoA dehydrogenase
MPPERNAEGRAWQRLLFDNGFAGIHWPTEFGGRGLTPQHSAAWMLQCALAGVPPVLNMVGLVLAGQGILAFGTDAQKSELLTATLRGDIVWCQLFSEPGAGSDLGSLSTRAVADGERFIVNGQKVWTSGGRVSDWGILMARTDPDLPKHHGISFFVIPMDLPGIEVRPLRQMTGDAEFDEVFFTDVEIPSTSLLGGLNEGWNVGMVTLTSERGHIGTSVISLSRRLEQIAALGTAAGSTGFGLDAHQRQAIAAQYSKGSAFRAMGLRQGPQASTASSLMKLGITEMMFDIAMLRGDIAGPEAMLDGNASRGMMQAPGGRIAGGTSQVQRNIIGERLLGLPREPKAQG